MTRTGFDGLLAPFLELLTLGRRSIDLRLALAKAELRLRASSLVTAFVLFLLALVLAVIVTVLLVQAGLAGLAGLGLTPLQALAVAATFCAALALVLVAMARSCLRRALRPLSHTHTAGATMPAAADPYP